MFRLDECFSLNAQKPEFGMKLQTMLCFVSVTPSLWYVMNELSFRLKHFAFVLHHSHWAAPTHDPTPFVTREDPHSFPPHHISARRSGRPSSWASRRSSPRGRGSWAVWKPRWSSWLPRRSLHRCSNTEHRTGRRNQKVKDERNTSGFGHSAGLWPASCAKIENVKRFIIRVHLQKPNTGRSLSQGAALHPLVVASCPNTTSLNSNIFI